MSILVTGGALLEPIDGVRFYANYTQVSDAGLHTARAITAAGQQVTLIAPPFSATQNAFETITHTANGIPILTARDMLAALEEYASAHTPERIIHCASTCSFRPAHAVTEKLKIKRQEGHTVEMQVVGNVNLAQHLQRLFPHAAIETSTFATPATLQHKKIAAPENGPLKGKHIIVTSGPTVETLTLQGDVISNFSSGRQGHTIAVALAEAAARVTLICGRTALPDPAYDNITTLHTSTARAMQHAAVNTLPADAYIGVAAVADFGLETPLDLRLREGEAHTLHLTQNPDILRELSRHEKRPRAVIGFAAETATGDALLAYARGKLQAKGADVICANSVQVNRHGGGENRITWLTQTGAEPWPLLSKQETGERIAKKLAEML